MFFLSPIWLFGLIPWTALAVWMLWGKRPAAVVPFIDLWRGPVTGKYVERAVHPPPRAIVMILLAALLALLAAAQPTVRGKGGRRVTIIIDRGMTMSALGRERPRFVETSELARPGLRHALDASGLVADEVRIVIVPNGGPLAGSLEDWTSIVSHSSPTAFDTRDALAAAIGREQLHSDVVIAVTDQPVSSASDRIVQISPENALSNAGIASIAARQTPSAQVMVRLRNDSPLTRGRIIVTTAGQQIERDVDLPVRGGMADRFIDLPAVDDVIHATLIAKDPLPADNEAWLVRERSWPTIEPRIAIPATLARMIEVYSRARPAAPDSATHVAIVADEKALRNGEPGVVLASSRANEPINKPSATQPDGAAPIVTDHPVTQNVAWPNALNGADIAPAPAGWTPVVSMGPHAIVAVREGEARGVWIGFESGAFPRSTDYVVLWTNVFDWLGRGGESFVAHPIAQLGDEWEPVSLAAGAPPGTKWWPGLYSRKGDAALRAMNAAAPRIEPPLDANWRAQLRRIAEARATSGGFRLAPWALVAALACLLAAGGWWPGRGLTRFSGGRTV